MELRQQVCGLIQMLKLAQTVPQGAVSSWNLFWEEMTLDYPERLWVRGVVSSSLHTSAHIFVGCLMVCRTFVEVEDRWYQFSKDLVTSG